jgi:hypothetical protein
LYLRPAFIADFHVSVRRSFRRNLQEYEFANVKNRNAREKAIARKHHTWKIPLWSAVGKSVKPPRRAVLPLRNLRPEPMLELAKGFEPLTL